MPPSGCRGPLAGLRRPGGPRRRLSGHGRPRPPGGEQLSANGLWDKGFQFGDWLDPAAPPDDPAAARRTRAWSPGRASPRTGSRCPTDPFSESALDPADVGRHGRVGLRERRPVAVRLPAGPRHPDRGSLQKGVSGTGHLRCGAYLMTSGTTNGTIPSAAPARHPGRGASPGGSARVEQERRGRGEDRQVAGPAQPLVALRAVRRHVDEVAALTPDHIAVQLVEQRVGALEGADALELEETTTATSEPGVSSPGQPTTSA